MEELTLNCWVRSQDAGEIFQVKISKTGTVLALKEAIKDKNPAAFRDMDAYALSIYKPRDPLPRPCKEDLSKFVLSEHGEYLEIGDDELTGVFPEPPPSCHIHIIVDAPIIICWLRGGTLSARFSTRPGASEGINQLIHHIKDAQPNLKDVADHHIRLYRVSGDENQLQESLNKTGDGELLRGDTLLPHFLHASVLDPLCVVAEVSSTRWPETIGEREHDLDLPHGKKRLRSPSPSTDLGKTKRKRMVSDDIADFHSEIWDKGLNAHTTVFVTTPVEQLESTGVDVPSQCCVMKSPPYGSGSTEIFGVFIRNEFVLAVENIVAFYRGENFTDDSKGDDDDDDDDDDSATTEAQSQFPLVITNPFLAPDFPLEGTKTGVIITGTTGIGKSVLLEFILHLRNLAGRPTIFIQDNGRVDLFTSDGVFRYEGSQIDKSELPPSVWAFVDSKTHLIGVPEWVRSLGCFIVQAAPPTQDHLKWELEEVGVSRYILKKWSLEEVLAARTLQDEAPSGTQLKTFFERYTPPPIIAYDHAACIEDFEVRLQIDIDSLSMEAVTNMVDDLASFRTDANLPHLLFAIQPGKTRSSFVLEFASQQIMEMLVIALERKVSNAARKLVDIWLHPITRSLAGQLFRSIFRGDFARAAISSNPLAVVLASLIQGHYPWR